MATAAATTTATTNPAAPSAGGTITTVTATIDSLVRDLEGIHHRPGRRLVAGFAAGFEGVGDDVDAVAHGGHQLHKHKVEARELERPGAAVRLTAGELDLVRFLGERGSLGFHLLLEGR